MKRPRLAGTLLIVAALAAGAAACGSGGGATAEILIVVDADYRITNDTTTQIDQIVFSVGPAGSTTPQTSSRMISSPGDLPVTLAVVSSGATSAIDVQVLANRFGGYVTARRAFGVPFAPGEVRVLRMDLLFGCTDSLDSNLCPPGTSCGSNACEPPATVPADSTSTGRLPCAQDAAGCLGFITIEKAGSGSGIVGSTPAGIDCGTASCTARFTSGSSVTLHALADPGSSFLEWTGDCAGTADCVLSLPGNYFVGAVFLGGGVEGAWSIPTQPMFTAPADGATDVAADRSGNPVVVGMFTGSAGFGADVLTAPEPSLQHGFVARLDTAGWHRTIADSSGSQLPRAVAVAPDDAVLVAGTFDGTLSGCGSPLVSHGQTDIFVLRFAAGANCVAAYSTGGTMFDDVADIAVQSDGSVVLVGATGGGDLFGGAGLAGPGYVAALDPSLAPLWVHSLIASTANPRGVAVGAVNQIAVTGSYRDSLYVDVASAGITSFMSSSDVFVATFDAAGTFGLAQTFGGADGDNGVGVAIDLDPAQPNVYVTGIARGTANFLGTNVVADTAGDVFVASLAASNLGLNWVRSFGGATFDAPGAIAFDPTGGVVVTGGFQSASVAPPNPMGQPWALPALTNRDSTGSTADIFAFKVDRAGNFLWAWAFGTAEATAATHNDDGLGVVVGPSGDSLIAGSFGQTYGTVAGSTIQFGSLSPLAATQAPMGMPNDVATPFVLHLGL